MMASICERLARNYRHWRSGFPDLILWSDTDVIFVEVKGPGDTLSFKQKVWLDFLISIGLKAEVCLVQDVSRKKIRN
jgi:Fanconi-associated nuclease 1